MHCFEETRKIACSVTTMYQLVIDIPAYPEFLPWVAEATVLKQTSDTITARLVAELAGIHYAFSTVDRIMPNKLVEIRLLDGPFKFLESVWSFDPIDDHQCQVHFSIEFAFKNMMIDVIAAPLFSAACRTMVEAFEQRAISQ
ncbi:MAG: type II toxin-antitoxin system RatA family toxin [Mariprofundales bacterium]